MKRLSLLAGIGLTCFALAGPAQADEPASKSAGPGAARPAAYTYFMRPPGVGKQYDTWADASGADIGEVAVDPKRLPPRVDHSARPEFPPIYNQKFGACGQYTAVASMFTYEMNVLNGTKADTNERRFPATFSWNMINRAENNGSEAYHGWEVAKRLGIPTIKTYGSVEEKKLGAWPNGYAIWREAMNYRVTGYRYTPAQTVDQLNEARGWLFDRNQPTEDNKRVAGGLLAMDGRMGKGAVIRKVTKTIPDGQYAAGQDVWIGWSASGFGHGMTCVGYDDQVGYDVNGDGKITNDQDITGDGKVTLADWERGAYIVVNSWGRSWSGDGKIYLLYSAMIDETWERGRYLGRVEVARHTPRMTLRFKLSCNDRTNLRMTVGLAGRANMTRPEQTYVPEAFNGWPVFGKRGHSGYVPMAGPSDDTPLEAGVDLTPLIEKLGPEVRGKGRLFLTLSRADGSKVEGELQEAAIRRYDASGQFIAEQPINIKQGAFGKQPLVVTDIVDPIAYD